LLRLLGLLALLVACTSPSCQDGGRGRSASGAPAPAQASISLPPVERRPPPVFPLRVAPGGRHLEDQRGIPFLIKGETAWLALANLTEEEQELYLADRASKGFDLIEVMLTNHDYTRAPNPAPPANRRGEQPFFRPGDFSTPNPAYFDQAARFVDRAASHGIAILLAPNYLGFDGGQEGWWGPLISEPNTREVCAAFGRFLGERFRTRSNVLWLAGGDFAPPPGSEGEARHLALIEGIRQAGATQLWTGHWNVDHLGGISTDQALFASRMELIGVYQYADTYRFTARAYDLQPPRPVFLLESTYEHEHPKSHAQPFRKAWWWSMLSGASGVVWSNFFLWRAESARERYRADYGDSDETISSWREELSSPGTAQAMQLHRFFESLPWPRLVPAGTRTGTAELVTWGQRWGEGHIAVASTLEGDVVVAYVPPTSDPDRQFRLDLSGLRRPARARWFDPVRGRFTRPWPIDEPPGEVHFEVPGRNAAGLDDWVLLVETVPVPAPAR